MTKAEVIASDQGDLDSHFLHDPRTIAEKYLHQPFPLHHTLIDRAANMVGELLDQRPETWSSVALTFIDVQTQTGRVARLMGGAILANHPALPESWILDRETARTVLTIAGHIDLGLSRALHESTPMKNSPQVLDLLQSKEDFITDLQAS